VFSDDGKLLQFVMIPRDETTNCAFGGDDLRTLFVTAGGSLWKIASKTPGRKACATVAANREAIIEYCSAVLYV
jgi:gluconolactonase